MYLPITFLFCILLEQFSKAYSRLKRLRDEKS